MLIRFGYELTFNCAEPTLMVCLLDAHRDHAPNIRFDTPFETTPAISTGTYFDTTQASGNANQSGKEDEVIFPRACSASNPENRNLS
jgi:hypothetical protein